jgi:SigmaK-factor processing regulatory protein BofA
VEPIILVVVVVLVVLILLGQRPGSWSGLIVNGIVGVVLLFLTNLFLGDDLPINLLTVIICALGGVVGWLIILVLHILGIAFESVVARRFSGRLAVLCRRKIRVVVNLLARGN